jgi:hypothetical protein
MLQMLTFFNPTTALLHSFLEVILDKCFEMKTVLGDIEQAIFILFR